MAEQKESVGKPPPTDSTALYVRVVSLFVCPVMERHRRTSVDVATFYAVQSIYRVRVKVPDGVSVRDMHSIRTVARSLATKPPVRDILQLLAVSRYPMQSS